MTSTMTSSRPGVVHRWSRTLIPTLRDAPAEATTPSHQLMLRAGYIRQVAAGVYDYLPLGLRVLRRVSDIVREEMDAAGAAELLLPTLVPLELYAGTKRDEAYGDLLFRLTDRHDRGTALGPTHEETVTELVKGSVTSYKQLPVTVYQIQTKFRDEFRPRAGLLRAREFTMKDAYSFHTSIGGEGGLNETYGRLYEAYVNIFSRCGLAFTVVEAEAGPIGGSASHEFMVNADTGEDTILVCPTSGYAANVEKCEIGERAWAFSESAGSALVSHHTPGLQSIEAVADHLAVQPHCMLKSVIFQKVSGDGGWVIAVVRGDHEVNQGKVRDALGEPVELADEAGARDAGFAIGYVSPRACSVVENTIVLIDPDAVASPGNAGWTTGSDKPDHHDTGFEWARDLGHELPRAGESDGLVRVADVRNAQTGDVSPRDVSSKLEACRGIEVGHIFKLGTIYSKAFDFVVLDEQQKKTDVVMGCYGIGVSRVLGAAVEQAHDSGGIRWPAAIAPYEVIITVMDPKKDEHVATADRIAAELTSAGLSVLIDDRKERPGVKFKDADLIGIPVRLTIGDKALDQRCVEFKLRGADGKGDLVALDDACRTVVEAVGRGGLG
ncbi:MAG: proline--tRNA ligase [Planctomycetota bacterium]